MTPRRFCAQCANRGVIRLAYHSGESSDVLLCACAAGQVWRHVGEAVVRERFGLSKEQQVANLEDAELDVPPTSQKRPRVERLIAVGKTAKRAKL